MPEVEKVENGIPKETKLNRTFYYYFRPIAVLIKLSGIFPLQNVHSSNGRNVKFRYKSLAHLYSTCVFIALLILLFIYCDFIFMPFFYGIAMLPPRLQEAIFWKSIVIYLMIIRSVLAYWFCVHHLKALPQVIKYLVMFDLKKASLLDMEPKRCIFRWTLLPLIIGSICLYSYLIELCYFIAKDENYVNIGVADFNSTYRAGIIFGSLGMWQEIPMLVFIYFGMIIVYDFKHLTAAMEKSGVESQLMRETLSTKCDCDNLAQVLGNARHLHGILSAAVKELSNSYGWFLATDHITLIVMTVVNVFTYCFTDVADIHLLTFTIQLFIAIISIVTISHKIQERAADILNVIRGIPLSTLDTSSRLEIQILTSQLAANPIQVSAAGFFSVNRTQINSFVAAVATYFIVLVQFSTQVQFGWSKPNNQTTIFQGHIYSSGKLKGVENTMVLLT